MIINKRSVKDFTGPYEKYIVEFDSTTITRAGEAILHIKDSDEYLSAKCVSNLQVLDTHEDGESYSTSSAEDTYSDGLSKIYEEIKYLLSEESETLGKDLLELLNDKSPQEFLEFVEDYKSSKLPKINEYDEVQFGKDKDSTFMVTSIVNDSNGNPFYVKGVSLDDGDVWSCHISDVTPTGVKYSISSTEDFDIPNIIINREA